MDPQLLALLAASSLTGAGTSAVGVADWFMGDSKAWNSGEIPLNYLIAMMPAMGAAAGRGAYTLADPVLREQFLNEWAELTRKNPDGTIPKQGTYSDAGPFKNQKYGFDLDPQGFGYEVKTPVDIDSIPNPNNPGVSPNRVKRAAAGLPDAYSVNDYVTANQGVLNRANKRRAGAALIGALLGAGMAIPKFKDDDGNNAPLNKQALLAT